jgi:membrane protein required for colicin V production
VNFLDFLLIVIVGYSVVTGGLAGFARVGIGFAATVVGVLCGFWFYGIPGRFLNDYLQSETASNLLGFFIVFSAVVLAGGLLGRLLSSVFKWAGLSWLDRLMGAGFGFVRGTFLAVAIVTVITAFAPNPPPRFIVESRIMPYATAAGNVFAAVAPHDLNEAYHASVVKLKRKWEGVKLSRKPQKLRGESF